MSKKDTYLTYTGDIRGLITDGKQIAFVTEHAESHPTAIYLIDAETNKQTEIALPCGGVSILKTGKTFWVGGTDGSLYTATDKQAKAAPAKLPCVATKLIQVSKTEIACLTGQQVQIVDAKGKIAQTIELSSAIKKPKTGDSKKSDSVAGSALACSPDGNWLVAGLADGTVSVFERETESEFMLSEFTQIHQGEVTAILFDPDELRFFSAGADQKLLSTHARGSLEPEDRGRSNNHSGRVTAIVLAGEDRMITGSSDKTCKTWTRSGATKPATLSDGIIAVTDLAVATVHKRPMLVAAESDNSIRLFLLTEEGKFGQASATYHDGFARAKELLQSRSAADQGQALQELAVNDDRKSLSMMSEFGKVAPDHKLRLTAVQLLCKSKHDCQEELLEPLLGHADEPIRAAVFDQLSKSRTSTVDQLALCGKAIATSHADIGCAALKVVEKICKDDKESDAIKNRARDLIVKTIDNQNVDTRRAAILSLENAFEKKSPTPTLITLRSSNAESRRDGLIRMMQRGLLNDEVAQAGLRQKIEDDDPNVRKAACLLLLLSKKKLAEAIRELDRGIDRQLVDLENFTLTPTKTKKQTKLSSDKTEEVKPADPKPTDAKPADAKPAKARTSKSKSKTIPKLKDDDLQPLLIAISSRSMDTCLFGTKCLALLQDPRAFGLLIQLSREPDTQARVEVCKAMAALADPRADDRLYAMLRDEAIEVRDAAYSAITTIHKDPLVAAGAGLIAPAVDIRKRGLETLVKVVRKSPPKNDKDLASLFVKRALNDADESVRNETFKLVLNSQMHGGGEHSLRFALQSIHPNVRREVLRETIALKNEDWSAGLLLDFLDDPDAEIRSETFNHLKKTKRDSDLQWLEDAIKREYPDVRLLACERLIKNKTAASQTILLSAIDDEPEIRAMALKSLVNSNATEQLREALKNKNEDIRLGAAFALASQGDDASCETLVSIIEREKPKDKAFQDLWRMNTIKALAGLSQLSDPATLDAILPLLDSDEPQIQKNAAITMTWVSRSASFEQVLPFTRHENEVVKIRAALSAVMAGDSTYLSTVLDPQQNQLDSDLRLVAAASLEDSGEPYLVSMLDHTESSIRNAALIVLLSRDWLQPDGTPRRVIACLGTDCSKVRLFASRALETFASPKEFAAAIADVFNDRGDLPAWTIDETTIQQVASVLVFAPNHFKARLIFVLMQLDKAKQNEWDLAWAGFSHRYAKEIKAAEATAKKVKPPKITSDQSSLAQLAFGTYVGLAREQSGYERTSHQLRSGSTLITIRSSAIRRLAKLTQQEKSFAQSTVSVLTQTAGDPHQEIRKLAFDLLGEAGVDDERRAEIAIGSGHRDLGVLGLNLLTSSSNKTQQQKILQNVVLTHSDNIAFDAATMLREQMDIVKLCQLCFDSPFMRLPGVATSWLTEAYDSDPKAKKLLQSLAFNSENEQIRKTAISCLVSNRDAKAFEAVTTVMEESGEAQRTIYMKMLSAIQAPGTAEFLLDSLEQHPEYTPNPYLVAIGMTRDAGAVPRLLALYDKHPKWRGAIYHCAIKIAGYDQAVHDTNEELTDQAYLEHQHPRNDDVLAELLPTVNRHGGTQLKQLIPHARWAKGTQVDAPLAAVAIQADEKIRNLAIEAIGFRAHRRDGDTAALAAALKQKQPETQFLAAEGLAKSGDAQGMQVLLTAIEMMEDLKLRRRAVLALGYLADERAFDVLMKLATEDGHALQDSAAEAIGHLRQSDHKDKIVKTLNQLVKSEGSAAERALIGFRWLDVPEGWTTIRDRASRDNPIQWEAIRQLGYDDDQASKAILLELLEQHPRFFANGQYLNLTPNDILLVAKRAFGDDSVEPDLAWAKSNSQLYRFREPQSLLVLKRIRDLANADQIFDLLGHCVPEFREELTRHLLQLNPVPIDIAVNWLDDSNPSIVQTCGYLIGRSGVTKHAKKIATSLKHWFEKVVVRNEQMTLRNEYQADDFSAMVSCCQELIWAAGALGGQEKLLAEIVSANPGSDDLLPVRQAAINSLNRLDKIPAAAIKVLEQSVEDNDAQIRSGVLEAMTKADNPKLDSLAQQVLPDRTAFQKLARNQAAEIEKTLKANAGDAHYQPRTLPYLIESNESKTLAAVAEDSKLDIVARLGAVEGLAKIGGSAVEMSLLAIGKNEKFEEDLRKAAWKALRRTKRQVKRQSERERLTESKG